MINVSYLDLAGVARTKPKAAAEIDDIFNNGVKTAKANLAINTLDALTPDSTLTVAHGDLSIMPDASTLALPSYAPKTARFVGDLYELNGSPSSLCSRTVYRRVLEQAGSMGYQFVAGSEIEFHLVNQQDDRVVPADTSRIQSQAGYDFHQAIMADFLAALESMNVHVIKTHVEGGRGQLEIDLAYGEGLKPADDIVYFKDAVKAVARQHGWIASFMPKIGHHWWGSGVHIHLSLHDPDGANLLYDEGDERKLGLSQLGYHFMGGVLSHTRALCAVAAPIINSYKRLLPGRWNADAVVYGPGHRGAAIRIPDERGKATRLEYRVPDTASNPYLLMACILAAGLEGIKRKIDPRDPVTYDISPMTDRERVARGLTLLPRSLGEALGEFEKDRLFRETLGDTLFEEYIKNRASEIQQAADQVTDWEVRHFLDLF